MKLTDLVEGQSKKTYAIRPQGKGETQVHRLIDRDSGDLHHMFFDNEDQARKYCEKNGHTVDNSSLDD